MVNVGHARTPKHDIVGSAERPDGEQIFLRQGNRKYKQRGPRQSKTRQQKQVTTTSFAARKMSFTHPCAPETWSGEPAREVINFESVGRPDRFGPT